MKTNPLPRFIQNAVEINIIGPCSIDSSTLNCSLPTLVIDGGINHQLALEQQFSLGDGDSSSDKLDLTLPTKKDMSDLSYALDQLLDKKRTLYIYGMIGERKDHEYINIGEAYNFSKRTDSIVKFDKNFLILPKGQNILNIYGEFSVITIDKALITIEGKARYTLDKETELFPLSSLGLSNIGDGEITLKSNSPLIIYTQGQSLT